MRRRGLLSLAALPWAAESVTDTAGDSARRGRAIAFPRDHGAHLSARIEWWYLTGWLGTFSAPQIGFQVTFFRSLTGLAAGHPSRFAARHLLFAHAAVTDVAARRHLHTQRIARWSGAAQAALGHAGEDETDVRLGPWRLWREALGTLHALVDGDAVSIDVMLQPTQPMLLQGDAGWSRKGPQESQASRYYSQPQLQARGHTGLTGGADLSGSAWLDHEWSDDLLHPDAVGWDWIGMNLQDGSALTAFRLRRADGSALWAGGSWRMPGQPARIFGPGDVRFEPGRLWTSPATGTRYPVRWSIETPAGSFAVNALLDAQELDSRASTGTLYWEGLAELLDSQQRRVGLGYLELTGYATPLRL